MSIGILIQTSINGRLLEIDEKIKVIKSLKCQLDEKVLKSHHQDFFQLI